MRCPLQSEMDNLGPTDHCHTLNEVSISSEVYALIGIPNNAAANCSREKGAEAVDPGAAMILRVVVSGRGGC